MDQKADTKKSASWLGLDENDNEEYENVFKKDEFEGTQGHAMLELKKTFKGDPRFKLTKLFVGDIDTKRLPNKVRFQLTETELKEVTKPTKAKEPLETHDSDLKSERKKGLEILSEIVPKSDLHFQMKKIEEVEPKKAKTRYAVPRYDPLLGKGLDLIVKPKVNEEEKKKEVKKLPKKQDKKLKEKVKDKKNKKVLLEDPIPKEVVVEINPEWKGIIQEKKDEKISFKLFGGDDQDTTKPAIEVVPEPQEVTEKEEDKQPPKEKLVKVKKEKDKKRKKSEDSNSESDKKKKKKKKWLKKIEGEDLEQLYVKEFGMTPEQFQSYQRYKAMIAEKRTKQQLK